MRTTAVRRKKHMTKKSGSFVFCLPCRRASLQRHKISASSFHHTEPPLFPRPQAIGSLSQYLHTRKTSRLNSSQQRYDQNHPQTAAEVFTFLPSPRGGEAPSAPDTNVKSQPHPHARICISAPPPLPRPLSALDKVHRTTSSSSTRATRAGDPRPPEPWGSPRTSRWCTTSPGTTRTSTRWACIRP